MPTLTAMGAIFLKDLVAKNSTPTSTVSGIEVHKKEASVTAAATSRTPDFLSSRATRP
jgi:hypothetical protein